MTVRIEDEVSIAIKGIEHHFSVQEIESLLETLALYGKANILKRTAEGVDVDERNFKPYSLSYKQFRKKKGRPTEKPDLNFTGRMLGSMRTRAKNLNASIFFARKEEADKAAGHSLGLGILKNAKREFFALSQKDMAALDQEVQDWLDEVLNAG